LRFEVGHRAFEGERTRAHPVNDYVVTAFVERLDARGRVAPFCVDALFPKITRLHHMGVGGKQSFRILLVGHKSSVIHAHAVRVKR
jgi:hypothetical protein